jgi:hypothetical protein
MQYDLESAGNLLGKILDETGGRNLVGTNRHIFNACFFKGLLEELIVHNESVAVFVEERLDTVRKLNKLGKL